MTYRSSIPTVSRHHLAIEWSGDAWGIADAGSTKRFYADGVRSTGMVLSGNHRIGRQHGRAAGRHCSAAAGGRWGCWAGPISIGADYTPRCPATPSGESRAGPSRPPQDSMWRQRRHTCRPSRNRAPPRPPSRRAGSPVRPPQSRERAIFVRERAAGLRPGAYLLAELLVFFVVSLLQCAVMVAIT